MSDKQMEFKLLSDDYGYKTYYKTFHNGDTIMFVLKDSKIVYIPPQEVSQFYMKLACEQWIEITLKELKQDD